MPRFQRGFVWRRDQVLELFESIRKRYPIGSLLIWRTRERFASFDRVGPIAVPPDEPKSPAEVGYVFDGHQRLSTLFGVFALTDDEAGGLHGAERAFIVYYDLAKEKFCYERYPGQEHLPVRYLLGRDDRLTEWVDARRDATEPGSPAREQWDRLRRRALQLQTTFAQYLLPYIDVTEADLDEAVNIFCKLNSQGKPMRRAEVFAALTWQRDAFDFAGEARPLLADLQVTASHPLRAAILASHVIPDEALVALLAGDEARFLELRERALIAAERDFASQYVDVPPAGAEQVEEEPEVDVEDDSEPDFV